MRALKAMGLKPTVFHMNEGHSAFLALEQIRLLMREHELTLRRGAGGGARQQRLHHPHAGAGRHRPVRPRPDVPLFLANTARRSASISSSSWRSAGAIRTTATSASRWPCWRSRRRPTATPSAACTAQVSQEMFHDLWPQLPVWEVPITSITNGVHLPSWLNGDLALLYDQYLQPDWRERFNDPEHLGAGARTSPTRNCWKCTAGASAAWSAFVRDAAAGLRGAAAGFAAGSAALRRGARSERLHHRLRAPLRHLQARHAAVPRRGAAEDDSAEQGHAGADRDRRQGASQGSAGQDASSARSCSFRATPTCGSTWSSWKTTT